MKRFFITILILMILTTALFAQSNSRYKARLLVIGEGDELYFWWGHVGLVIEDTETNQSLFYDYGVFSFKEDNFFVNFALGNLYYDSVRIGTIPYINYIISTNRSVTYYDLNFSNLELERLVEYVEEHIKEDKSVYLYNHYSNNCSNRIADAIDFALDGELYKPEDFIQADDTYRTLFRRYSYENFWMDIVLNTIQGPFVDEKLEYYRRIYVPNELAYFLQDKGIATDVEIIHTADRPSGWKADIVPSNQGKTLLVGLALAIIFILLKFFSYKKIEKITFSIISILLGLLGSLMFFLIFFTNWEFALNNLNIFLLMPTLLAMPFVYKYEKWNKWYITFHSILAIVSIVINLIRPIPQDNSLTLLLLIPTYIVISHPVDNLIRNISRKILKKDD